MYKRWEERETAIYLADRFLFNNHFNYVNNYKDAWVRYNKINIKTAALANQIPSEVLGAVAWNEVGGDPYDIDEFIFKQRTNYTEFYNYFKNSTIYKYSQKLPLGIQSKLKSVPSLPIVNKFTKPPLETSFGSVQIQIRRVAETMGLDPKKLDSMQVRMMINVLRDDKINLQIVAKHLRDLLILDNPGLVNTCAIIDDEKIRILGARYNWGREWPIEHIKKHTSYGDTMVRRIPHVKELLK